VHTFRRSAATPAPSGQADAAAVFEVAHGQHHAPHRHPSRRPARWRRWSLLVATRKARDLMAEPAWPAPCCGARDRAAHRRPAPVPHHRLEALPREALGCARRALAQPPWRRHRGRARGRPRPPPREARQEEGPREEAQGRAAAPVRAAAAHPSRGEASGLDPRRRPVPVAGNFRRSLWLDPAARARPHRAGRAWGSLDGRQPPGDLQVSQSVCGEAGVRRRVDGPLHIESVARSGAGTFPVLGGTM
jgi:hypothetical protein